MSRRFASSLCVYQIDALLGEYTDAQVANVLNQRGLRTGAGDAFDPTAVQWVRYSAKIKSLKQRLLDARSRQSHVGADRTRAWHGMP